MKPQMPPLVRANDVLPHRGVAGYAGVVQVLGAAVQEFAPPAAVDAVVVGPATGDIESLPRPALVRLAISLGLKGSGKNDELIAAIRERVSPQP